tara:strand:- start:3747 stop:4640 length:894 start_codon:yes stop_codon:yes gene_type:complete
VNKSKELIIGIFACISLAILYWGINFLKGENVFSQKNVFYAVYENVDGLTISRPVTVNGFKVGQVSNINLHSKQIADLIVEVTIEEDINFSTSSLLEIYDSDILGAKSLELIMIQGAKIAQSGDTLKGSIATGLTSEVSEQFGSVKVGLDQLIISFDKVLKEVKDLSNTANRILLNNEEKLNTSIYSIESIASEIDNQAININNIIDNLSSFTDTLNSIDVHSFSNKIINISNQLEMMLVQLNKGDGSLAKVLNEDSIYIDLSNTIKSMDELLNDVRQNPKKYINISLWGGDKKNAK